MAFPDGAQMVDPRTQQPGEFLSCLNIVPVVGGRNIEDTADYKTNAPTSYLRSYSTATTDVYSDQIDKYTPVNLLHYRIFNSDINNENSYGVKEGSTKYVSSLSGNGVLQEINSVKKSILLTAIRANGSKIEDPVEEFLNPLNMAL
jgi:hypothetical protein